MSVDRVYLAVKGRMVTMFAMLDCWVDIVRAYGEETLRMKLGNRVGFALT